MSDTTVATGALDNPVCVCTVPCYMCVLPKTYAPVCVDAASVREVVVDCANERCTYDVRRFCRSCGGQLSFTNRERASKCFFKKDSTSVTLQAV